MARYTRVSTVFSEPFEHITLLIDHETGRRAELNAAAVCVWESLESSAEPSDIARALVARFAIDLARANADAQAALDSLLACGLIKVKPPAPT